jgi:hypothetical protein
MSRRDDLDEERRKVNNIIDDLIRKKAIHDKLFEEDFTNAGKYPKIGKSKGEKERFLKWETLTMEYPERMDDYLRKKKSVKPKSKRKCSCKKK